MTPKEIGFKLAYAHYEAESCRGEDADRLALEIAKALEEATAEIKAEVQITEALIKPTEQQRDELKAERDRLKLENGDLMDDLERARTYTGVEAQGCPLCTYVDGVFKKSCSFHREIAALELQVKEAGKLLNEFTTNKTVCQALGPTCIGGHQEDPCKCLYCRTRHQLSMMD
jgi:hypothetical protein